jgi:hypothetical protein
MKRKHKCFVGALAGTGAGKGDMLVIAPLFDSVVEEFAAGGRSAVVDGVNLDDAGRVSAPVKSFLPANGRMSV